MKPDIHLETRNSYMWKSFLMYIHFTNFFSIETLRKYPALPFITRKCVLDYHVPNSDLVLEVGTNVLIPIKSIHHDENIYEDPEKFNPDRFSAEQRHTRHQYAHMPFGGGPRNCIGIFFLNNTVYWVQECSSVKN